MMDDPLGVKRGQLPSNRADLLAALIILARVEVTLKVGVVTETVTVTAETAAQQTDRSEVRADISTNR